MKTGQSSSKVEERQKHSIFALIIWNGVALSMHTCMQNNMTGYESSEGMKEGA
jgi:hypothetical protein